MVSMGLIVANPLGNKEFTALHKLTESTNTIVRVVSNSTHTLHSLQIHTNLSIMNSEAFKKAGYDMIQIAYDYMATLDKREPLPDVKPGYLKAIVPPDPPEHPESWESIKKDIEAVALKGVKHNSSIIIQADYNNFSHY